MSNFKASIDSTSGRKSIYGYVINLSDTNAIVRTSIVIDDKDSYPILCNSYKKFLEELYYSGFHGFKIEIPNKYRDGKEHEVKILVPGSNNDIICKSSLRFSLLDESESLINTIPDQTIPSEKSINITSESNPLIVKSNTTLNDILSENTKLLVSVVIACYNCEDFIDQCIQSLIDQTYHNFEIICVDDGSTDSTLEKLKQYESKYDYIHVYTQKNQYAGVARNHGMEYAKGEYLLFLDSDDFFEPNMLELTIGSALKNNAEIVVFAGQEYDCLTHEFHPCKFPVSPSLFPKAKTVFSSADFGEKLFQANSCIAWNKLIKTSFAKKHSIKFGNTKSSNDTVFVYSLLSLAERITLVNEVLVNYRVNNPKSLQRSKSKHWETLLLAFFSLKKEMIKLGTYEKNKRTFVNKILQAICYYLSTIDKNTQKVMNSSLTNKYFSLLDLRNIQPQYIYNKNFYSKWIEINSRQYIPIVYSSNNDYVPYMSVSIQSILDNISENSVPVFYVLIDKDFSEENCKILQEQVRNYNSEINFIKVDNYFDINLKSRIDHISIQTFYRLAIPIVLQCYNKLIYLDCDTVVNGDITELYSTNVNDVYLSGVIAPAFVNKKHVVRLGIDTRNYINAGVLVINNRLLIKDKVHKRFIEAIDKKYDCMDQDILNVVCFGKIRNIHIKNNLMTKYFSNYNRYTDQWNITTDDFKNAIIKPYIIHYADKVKPWNDHKSPLASYFFMYSINSPFHDFFSKRYKIMTMN